MEQSTAVSDVAALNAKLDALAVQVEFLTEQARQTARRQQERSELVHDLMPIANDAVGLVTEQLEEIQEYVDLSDLLRLMKRLMRNSRNLDRMFDRLESLMDLAQTAGPLANSVFEKVTDQLEIAERKGYFALASGAVRTVDKAAAALTPEDIGRLAENIVVLAGVFKELDEPVDPSMLSLMRQIRDPDVRRGFAKVMRMLRAFGAHAATEQQATAEVKRSPQT